MYWFWEIDWQHPMLHFASVAEATGEAQTIWLPRTMSTGERRSEEEEAQWRALFGPPDSEFLVGLYACSLAEGKAETRSRFVAEAVHESLDATRPPGKTRRA